MKRLMGIDYGSKRVGVALTDEAGLMAFPHKVIDNDKNLLKNIVALVEEKEVGEIVIGHSVDLAGKPNEIHQKTEELITDLTLAVGVPIALEPEQYSTQAALRLQGRNKMTDASAATIILESFIAKRKQK